MTEQVPNPDSRVTLGTERDSLGQTRVRLDWRLSPIDILSVVRTQTIVDSELRRAGLGRLYTGSGTKRHRQGKSHGESTAAFTIWEQPACTTTPTRGWSIVIVRSTGSRTCSSLVRPSFRPLAMRTRC